MGDSSWSPPREGRRRYLVAIFHLGLYSVDTMSLTRLFLGWEAPAPQKVSDFLLPPGGSGSPDLSDTLVVVPTRQAGRRLRETMALTCAARDVALFDARVETPAFFLQSPTPAVPVAGPMQVSAAWCTVLLQAKPAAYEALFPAGVETRDFSWALRTGDMFQNLRESLSDGGLTVSTVVDDPPVELEELERWQDLAGLEACYLEQLSGLGLDDPCLAKIAHAANPTIPEGITRIVVAAVPDPTTLMLTAVQAMSDPLDVVILVHAPDTLADHFDDCGRPLPEAWREASVDVQDPDACILLAGTPQQQSQRALELLARHAGDHGPGDVAIGVPDASVTPFLEADLEEHGLAAFDPSGRSPRLHPLYGLLEGLHGLLASGAYGPLASLLRHPDVLAFLSEPPALAPRELLTQLDLFQGEHLPETLAAFRDEWLEPGYPVLQAAIGQLRRWLAQLKHEELPDALRAILQEVYAGRLVRPGHVDDAAFVAVARLLDQALHELAGSLVDHEALSGADALQLLLRRLSGQSFYLDREDAAIDLDGWLELPWNHAPLMIVTGMNDGHVPDGRLSDMFLPDALRTALGLRHDAGRLARDVYLLSSLVESRRREGHLYLVAGKTSHAGDPLKPSRLLFRCPDRALPDRAAKLFSDVPQARAHCPSTPVFRLQVAPPADVPASRLSLQKLSVTDFRGYLACPFRFYLQKVLQMDALDDSKTEWDALDFGVLVHGALQGLSEPTGVADSTDEATVSACLVSRLEASVTRRYGSKPPLQILIQREAAAQRLRRAAREHVRMRQDGWQTVACELACELTIEGMRIRGTIDRVDQHRETGAMRILDYKTSDGATPPLKTHLATCQDETPDYARVALDGKERRWTDLQLPLYRALLADRMSVPDEVTLGYFNLPRAIADTGLSLWDDYTPALHASAMACAGGVVRAVRDRVFWPPSDRVRYDAFETVFHRDLDEAVDHESFLAALATLDGELA